MIYSVVSRTSHFSISPQFPLWKIDKVASVFLVADGVEGGSGDGSLSHADVGTGLFPETHRRRTT